MATVSLTMIARDEAANLEGCVGPVRDLVDEVVVVDTGSTDATIDVAKRLGARVVEFPWCDDFSAARNTAIEHATGDWIFVLDADDRVIPPERDRLKAALSALGNEAVGYAMTQASVAVDGGLGGEVEQVRLFPRRPDVRWRYRVHEQIIPPLAEAGCSFMPTSVHLVHLGFADLELVRRKLERNLRLIELDCADRPLDVLPRFYRGAMLADAGRHAEAIVTLQLCVPFVDRRSGIGRAIASTLARSMRADGDREGALRTIRDARVGEEADPVLAHVEADLLLEAGDLPAAGVCLTPAATTPKDNFTLGDLRVRTLYGEVLVSLGYVDAAEAVARSLVDARPGFGPGWMLLVDTLLAGGRLAEVDLIVERLRHVQGTERIRVAALAALRQPIPYQHLSPR